MERAITFLETKELPPHWDKEILNIGYGDQESTNNSTTASSESEDLDDEDEEEQSPEEKDHLVAELYKHMEDRGSPIDKTPCIGKLNQEKSPKNLGLVYYIIFSSCFQIDGKDVDLYRLYVVVHRQGGHVRVTNKNAWRTVANKLGFYNNWGINQVRVHYNRYLRYVSMFFRKYI